MGGCASKPKEFSESAKETAPAPVEQPAKVEETVAPAAAVAEETTAPSADDKKDEAPLVDLSKPEEEETKAAEAVPVLVVENPKGETVEVEVAAKEGEIIYVEAVKEETKKEEKEEKKVEKKEEENKVEKKVEEKVEEKKEEEEKPKTTAPAATSEDKNEDPLVKV